MKSQKDSIVIRFKNLTKMFGSFTAVSNISLDIHRGEIVGFLGPNGAGKSTTMKMMARLIKPTHGEIWIRTNGNLEKLTSRNKDRLLNNLGFLIENPAFYEDRTPRQVLRYFALLKGYPKDLVNERIEDVIKMIGMGEWLDVKIGKFSKGMRQKIGVISAIVHDPDFIVLDEPHTGLDPQARKELRAFILKLKKMGKTIFLSSHLLYEVSEIADRIAIISNGSIVACDTLENLEMMMKQSIIHVELLNDANTDDTPTDPSAGNGFTNNVTNMKRTLEPYINGIGTPNHGIRYNSEMRRYEVHFDGTEANQYEILKSLLDSGFRVIDYSVPKAGLLEDVYMNFLSPTEVAEQ